MSAASEDKHRLDFLAQLGDEHEQEQLTGLGSRAGKLLDLIALRFSTYRSTMPSALAFRSALDDARKERARILPEQTRTRQ